MARTAMARRILALACLFLVSAPLRLASGQEVVAEGVREADSIIDLDEVLDELLDDLAAEEKVT